MNEIRDDEIRIIGEKRKPRFKTWMWLLLLLVCIIIGVVLWHVFLRRPDSKICSAIDSYADSSPVPCIIIENRRGVEQAPPLSHSKETGRGFIEISDTVINDIPMRLFIPHKVTMSLHLGEIDSNDSSILFAALAADVRADNGGIVGSYVLKGEIKARGKSKEGFCAIINDTVTIGVAANSPLFEEATEKEGYFFRQFPLVDNGILVENELKGKAIRRGLCDRNGEIFTIETLDMESFHDFAQALVDLGVDNAIYLIGSTAYGWAIDAQGRRHEFGKPNPKKWENRNYLIMREQP